MNLGCLLYKAMLLKMFFLKTLHSMYCRGFNSRYIFDKDIISESADLQTLRKSMIYKKYGFKMSDFSIRKQMTQNTDRPQAIYL